MRLHRNAGIVNRGRDVDDTTTRTGGIRLGQASFRVVLLHALEEMRDANLCRIVRTKDIDVDDRLEGIRTELLNWGKEVACSPGSEDLVSNTL